MGPSLPQRGWDLFVRTETHTPSNSIGPMLQTEGQRGYLPHPWAWYISHYKAMVASLWRRSHICPMPQHGGWRYWATCSRYGMAGSLLLPVSHQSLFLNGVKQAGLRSYSEMTQCSQPKPYYKEFKCPFHHLLTNTINTIYRVLPHPVCLYNVSSIWCPFEGGSYHHNYSKCHQPHLI